MTDVDQQLLRLKFLLRVVRRQSAHLATTDRRLFDCPFSIARAAQSRWMWSLRSGWRLL